MVFGRTLGDLEFFCFFFFFYSALVNLNDHKHNQRVRAYHKFLLWNLKNLKSFQHEMDNLLKTIIPQEKKFNLRDTITANTITRKLHENVE